MPSPFNIFVYSNIVRNNNLVASHWGYYAQGMIFATNAFGGYTTCNFTLRLSFDELRAYVLGWSQPSVTTDRLRIVDPFGVVCYEGMIYSLNLRAGAESIASSADSLFNIARVDYNSPRGTGVDVRQQHFDSASSRALFGNKVMRLEVPGTYYSSSTPLSVARRFVKQHLAPGQPQSKRKGSSDTDLALEVSCVGLMTPGTEWRYAFSNQADSVDSSRVVKDMLAPGSIADGVNGAGLGPTAGGWIERLNAGNSIAWGQQFISGTDFTHIATSGTNVERNIGSGSERIEIIKQAAQYGSVNDKRMLFQVWDDGATNAGKGIPYFVEMSEDRPFLSGYTGYYDNAHVPEVFDAGEQRLPLWRVRAGKWITTRGLVPSSNYPTVYNDPRCFWIEETQYDVDNGVLTLSTSSEFNIETYVGRMIGGKKVIKDLL